jgi:hypothetical protein
MVSDFEVLHTLSDGDNDSGTFVSTGERIAPGRQVSGEDMVVGVTQARGHHLDLNLTGARISKLDLGDLPLAWCLPQHGCSSSHAH